jgi:hypothetical protein
MGKPGAVRSTTGDDEHYPMLLSHGRHWGRWCCGGCHKWSGEGGTTKRAVNAHVRFTKKKVA